MGGGRTGGRGGGEGAAENGSKFRGQKGKGKGGELRMGERKFVCCLGSLCLLRASSRGSPKTKRMLNCSYFAACTSPRSSWRWMPDAHDTCCSAIPTAVADSHLHSSIYVASRRTTFLRWKHSCRHPTRPLRRRGRDGGTMSRGFRWRSEMRGPPSAAWSS